MKVSSKLLIKIQLTTYLRFIHGHPRPIIPHIIHTAILIILIHQHHRIGRRKPHISSNLQTPSANPDLLVLRIIPKGVIVLAALTAIQFHNDPAPHAVDMCCVPLAVGGVDVREGESAFAAAKVVAEVQAVVADLCMGKIRG